MNKIEEIFKAWGIMFNPNEQQNELASKRLEICNECEFKNSIPIQTCTICGCALKAKVFSPVNGACPKNKWDKLDQKYLDIKNKKSLI
jgi:hypothetical protein